MTKKNCLWSGKRKIWYVQKVCGLDCMKSPIDNFGTDMGALVSWRYSDTTLLMWPSSTTHVHQKVLMKWLLPVFASQVSLIYPLADLTIVYTTCPEISGHPIKLHLVNSMKTIWLKWSTINSCLNNIILFNILGFLHTTRFFKHNIAFVGWNEKRVITIINY